MLNFRPALIHSVWDFFADKEITHIEVGSSYASASFLHTVNVRLHLFHYRN